MGNYKWNQNNAHCMMHSTWLKDKSTVCENLHTLWSSSPLIKTYGTLWLHFSPNLDLPFKTAYLAGNQEAWVQVPVGANKFCTKQNSFLPPKKFLLNLTHMSRSFMAVAPNVCSREVGAFPCPLTYLVPFKTSTAVSHFNAE